MILVAYLKVDHNPLKTGFGVSGDFDKVFSSGIFRQ